MTKTLIQHIEENTLIRGAWTDTDSQGRETACLLAALAPECGVQETARVCPASVMPSWLAYLTPSIDDNGSIEAWPTMVRRYASLAGRWSALSELQWNRIKHSFLAYVVNFACKGIADNYVTEVCLSVAELHEKAARGELVTEQQWSAARSAAWSAAESAVESAVESAARSAARSAESAVESAVESAAWSAARSAAESAVESAAWDGITNHLFELIEKELAK